MFAMQSLQGTPRIFVFATPTDEALDLPVCGSVQVVAPGREHGGGDAVRPYTPVAEARAFERIGLPPPASAGEFALLVKRYREWGFKPEGDFDTHAFAASYRPAGACSNYIHEKPAAILFRHSAENLKLPYPFAGVDRINMIAVGAGIAPMVQALERLLFTSGDDTRVVLLYGNRSVEDILLRETLDEWAERFPARLKVVYCVGSRYANVKVGVKRAVKHQGLAFSIADLMEPPTPPGFETLPASSNQARETGWVGKAAVAKHAFPPHPKTRTFVCGLPEVYHSVCGPRDRTDLAPGSVLADLGYESRHVVKF